MRALFVLESVMKLKKPTSFEEQVKILESRGVIVKDRDAAVRFLSRVNYYRFTSYLLTYRNQDGRTYRPVDFQTIVNIYLFDQELRALSFNMIEDIEIFLRTQLAYYSAHHYGSEGYRYQANFNSNHNHAKYIAKLRQCIRENAQNPVVKHHRAKYNGHYPIWVIVEFFSIGLLSHFYRDMKNIDKATIAKNLYGTSYQVLDSWFRCINDLRNRCAHYSRLYYWKFSAIPRMDKTDNFVPDRRLFSQIYMLKNMYRNSAVWNNDYVKPLAALITKYKSDVNLRCIGFPDNWEELLTK